MSYIQIEIGGKLRGLKFLQHAVITMSKYVDIDNYAATSGYAMVYGGLKCNNYVKRVEDDFTFEQVCEWVDLLSREDLIKIHEVFAETQLYKDLVDKGATEVITKKKSKKTELKT